MDAKEDRDPVPERIVVVGGGFGGLFTARAAARMGDVTLIASEDHFLHTPMLYEYLSGEVEAWHIAPRYHELLEGDRVRLVQGAAVSVDFEAREVEVAGRLRRIPYDYLVLAVGGVTNFWGVEGADKHTMPFRKIRHADELRARMIEALDRVQPDAAPQDARESATFVVVGAGASGVELSTKMMDLLTDAFRRRGLRGEPRVVVVERALHDRRIEIHTGTRVVRVTSEGAVISHAGRETEIRAAGVVWTAGVRVNPLVEKLGVERDRRGLIVVEDSLQVRGRREVFALGDIAAARNIVPSLAGTAQLAFQQSSLVASNIQALIDGGVPARGHFQELGEAVSLGTDDAAVLAAGRVVTGQLARQARFALYTTRLPTWQHRLRVGASWFFGGKTPRPLGL